jgi:hypothetical protein
MSPKNEIESLLRIGIQFLNPKYDEKAPGGLVAQKEQEEGVLGAVVAALAKRDQDVVPMWKTIKKKRKGRG